MNDFNYKNMTPFKWFVLENFPFIENNFEAINNYRLFSKVVEYLNKMKDNVNLTGQQMENLTNAMIDLQNYVNNYFDNLDVQDEINNKLDEMVEQGTLQEIIADYLNSKAIFGFDTVQDMKQATNLINGSYAKTLGYYSKNDGGSGLYKIIPFTNQIIDNGEFIQINDNIVAQLISEEINVKLFGAYGNNINDDTTSFNNAINYAFKTNNYNVFVPSGNYLINGTIILKNEIKLIGENKYNSKIIQGINNIDSPLITTDITNNSQLQNISIDNISIISSGERRNYTILIYNTNSFNFINSRLIKQDNTLSNFHGLYVTKTQNFEGTIFITKISNSRFSKSFIKLNSTDGYIVNNEIWGDECECAIWLENASNNLIDGNQIVGGNIYGNIYIENTNDGLRITNNYFDGSYNDLNTQYGIYVNHLLYHSVISNNTFWKLKNGGIKCENINNTLITNNVFEETDYYNNGSPEIEISNGNNTFSNIISNNSFYRNKCLNEEKTSLIDRPINTVPIMIVNSSVAGSNPTLIINNNVSWDQFYKNIEATGNFICKNNMTSKLSTNSQLSTVNNTEMFNMRYEDNNDFRNKIITSHIPATITGNPRNWRINNVVLIESSSETSLDFNITSNQEFMYYINSSDNITNKPSFFTTPMILHFIPVRDSSTYGVEFCLYNNGFSFRFLINGQWGSWMTP